MRLLGDERLARLASAGHARAFAIVYERHHQALYRYCRSILRNEADAQDALQSTFTAAFAALSRNGRDVPIRPWLFRIAHNEAVSALRRRRPTAQLSEATELGTTSVEDEVGERARFDLLLRDLRELHERQRSALVMRELGGLSHEEIALALQTSVGAAKQAIYEARQSLFEFSEGRAMPCDEIRRTISDADGRLLRSRRVRAHLRDCSACAAFAAAIPARRSELLALAPTLPAVAAAGLLERACGAVVGHGSGASLGHGAGSGLAGLASGAAGKAVGASLAANALAGVAVVATATVGVTSGMDQLVHGPHLFPAAHSAPARSAAHRPSPASTPASVTRAPRAGALERSGSGAQARAGAFGPAHGHASRATAGHTRRSSAGRPGRGPAAGSSRQHGASATRAPSWTGSTSTGQATATTRTHPGHGPPAWAGSGSGHAGGAASAPGNANRTASAPGNPGAAPGHSGAAPGHTKAAGSSSAGGSGASGKTAGGSGTKPGKGPPPWAGSGKPSWASAGRSTASPLSAVPAVTSAPTTPVSTAPGASAGTPRTPGTPGSAHGHKSTT